MLRESPQHRPNIYQVVAEVCSMRHRACPIKDVCAAYYLQIFLLIRARYTPIAHIQKPEETNSYRQLSQMLLLRVW
jgi:hypothetical protein